MDQGAGEDASKSTAPPTTTTPPQQSSKTVQPSTMKKQVNGGGGGDAPSTSSGPAGAKGGPSDEQIAAMASAKAKGKKNGTGRGGKKNGDFPTYPEESVSSPRRGRGGSRGGGPRPQTHHADQYYYDDDEHYYQQQHYTQRGTNKKLGYQRGNPHKPVNSFSPRRHNDFQHDLNDSSRSYPVRRGKGFSNAPSRCPKTPSSSTSLPIAPNQKQRFSPDEREALGSLVSQFITPRPIQPTNNLPKDNSSSFKLDLEAFFANYKDDTTAAVASSGSGRPVCSYSAKLPFSISFDKIQVPGVVSKASTPETTATVPGPTAPPSVPVPEATATPTAPVPELTGPPKPPVPKPRTRTLLSRNDSGTSTESLSQPTTPVPVAVAVPEPEAVPTSSSSTINNSMSVPVLMPINVNVSTSSTFTTNNDTATPPMHPTPNPAPTAVNVTAPTLSSSSSSSQRQSDTGAPSLLQLMEEHERRQKANIAQMLAVKQPVPRPRPAIPARSFQNGVRNHNDSRSSGIPPGIIEQQKTLPIYPVKRELMDMIRKNRVVIVIGDPGSGKSTQLPQYLLEAGFAKNGKIGVTEPRRVAAKTLAERVALEVGQSVGNTVGYAVRFDRQMSGRTVIKYMTDGVLVQECANPAHLEEYSVVIIDEAHERSVHTDICFGLLKREAERDGSKLKIIISSATLEQKKFSEYFGGAPVFTIPGSTHQPTIKHKPESFGQVENCVEEAVTIIKGINLKIDFPKGDILVFLSGQDEIEEMTSDLRRMLHEINRPDSQLCIVQCYGALTFNEQMKIFDPAPENCRKVILATNIAETSITIEGVVYVIDCGYFKESFYNPVNGINYLVKRRITKFQATQRYGRAGRTEQGICFRVYSKRDLEEMDEAGAPEITRCNLESIILDLAAMGITGWEFNSEGKMTLANFDLMDLPSVDAFVEALTHLKQLFAVEVADTGIHITELGELMASFHLDPSLSRVLIESMRLGCEQEALKIVALLSANYSNIFDGHSVAKDTLEKFYHPDGDLLTFLNMYNAWLENGKKVDWCKALSLQHRVFQEAEDIRCQIQSILKRLNERNPQQSGPASQQSPESLHENIRKSFVAGYFRQFAFKKPSGPAYRHLANVAAPDEDVYLHPSSVFCNCGPPTPPKWIIYNAMMVTKKPYMRAVTVIDPEWIWDYAPAFAENLAKLNVLAPQVPPQYQEDESENDARRLALEC